MNRRLKASDLPAAAAFGRRFFEESGLSGEYSEERFLEFWGPLLDSGSAVIFGAFDEGVLVGAIGGISYPDLFTNETVSQDTFWYMAPEYRDGKAALLLLGMFTDWCREQGSERQRMGALISLSPRGMHGMFTRMGFHPVDIAYERAL